MAEVDIDPFGEHESRPEELTDENIPLDPVTSVGGGSTWDPRPGQSADHEQETSRFGLQCTCGPIRLGFHKDEKSKRKAPFCIRLNQSK